MKLNDLTGKRFGRLTVLGRAEANGRKGTYWLCLCDCGKTCSVLSGALVTGHTTSCCCYAKEVSSRAKTHGLCHTKEHAVWKAMRQRCNDKNAENYYRYGGRGIKICSEWNNFTNFYQWCKESGFKDGLTIDRIDNNGDYCPENCRWVDKIAQGNNKCNNRKVMYKGELLSLMQIERLTGIDHRTIGNRLNSGWTVEQATQIKPRYGNRIMAK